MTGHYHPTTMRCIVCRNKYIKTSRVLKILDEWEVWLGDDADEYYLYIRDLKQRIKDEGGKGK